MKKTSAKSIRRADTTDDEVQPEYDWSKAVRNPNAASVNEALRSLASVMAGRTPKPPGRRRTA
jgi:hypothetical protein